MRDSVSVAGNLSPIKPPAENDVPLLGTDVLAMIQGGLDKIDQGITIFDADLKLVFSNQRLHDLLDFPLELMPAGTAFEDVIRYNAERGEYGLGDTEEMVRERVAVARQFKEHTLERTRPNGVVLRISGWPLPGGGFATVYTDITEQRRRELSLESRLLRQTEDLRLNEERLRLIANEVPAGIAYLDSDQTFGFVNRRFAAAYQSAPSDLIGTLPREVLSARTMTAVQPFFNRAIAGEALDFDLEIDLPDGRVLDTRTFLRPERDHRGGCNGFYVLTINITRQKQAAAALLRAQKMEALGQLSSGIAHDFNNLLTVILGNLKPLEPHVEETLREDMLAPAVRAAKRGADLTRRLLAVARRRPLEPAPVDIAETAHNIAKLVKPSLPEDAVIGVDAPEVPCFGFVDPAQLETSLLNLVVNARDALHADGHIAITVMPRSVPEVEATDLGIESGDYIEVKVADNGAGISPAVMDKIFDPFFSTKNNHDRSGLGLTIVHSFVQDSHGAVRMKSRECAGSECQLLLPACAPGQVLPEEPLGSLPEELKSGLILLVEDDDEVRSVLRRDLVEMGCRLIEAHTAPEAFELVRTIHDVTLILSDIAMPGAYSGLELAQRVNAARPDIGIVLMTGFGREGLQEAVPDIRILQKPFGRRTLIRAFRELFPE
ncbi:MAG TPA: PAS-domain containing protein [Hyphomicrobiales bacterium]|nr:PAS-domain containing protein [Hyphomicrobiales bacterium]